MKGSTSFPPGAGWIPVTVALIIVLLASWVTLTPQWSTQLVGAAKNGTTAQTGVKGGTHKVTQTQIINGKAVQVQVDVPNDPGATLDTTSGGDAGTAGSAGSAGSGDTSVTSDGSLVGGSAGSAGGGGGGGGGGAGGGTTGTLSCSAAGNGGATDTGVDQSTIHLASTIVTDGVGGSFLGEAQNGLLAAVDEVNHAGGICGRRVAFDHLDNSSWDGATGARYISNYVNSGSVFALVGEPDSEGLRAAIESKIIDNAGIPVVGSDGMLASQYHDSLVWPVAASTVTNAHIVAKYAFDHGARTFGVVFDNRYKFGAEGAQAFNDEVKSLTGHDIPGFNTTGACSQAFCGVDGNQQGGYSSQVTSFDNNGCGPCDAVLMLLEPSPMEQWMRVESGSWYKALYGGEPLFDSKFAGGCGSACNGLRVWTGYNPAIAPFDSQAAVRTYVTSLHGRCSQCDPQNEFTEGAYLGTKLFIEAAKRLGAHGAALTRANLAAELNADSFDLGMTAAPISYAGKSLHLANTAMAMFAANYGGSTFNSFQYQSTGYIPDPAPGVDQ